ncbi:unnamed protein product [Ectocarpus sp. CCAP 1310/34]|nr:unnamed protein product [Ectocarpus sp. CCAP 1310/34]
MASTRDASAFGCKKTRVQNPLLAQFSSGVRKKKNGGWAKKRCTVYRTRNFWQCVAEVAHPQHAQKIIGKKVVLLPASRSGSGYPKKTSLA